MIRKYTAILIFSFVVSQIANATNYYVSSTSGSDSNAGTSAATAWKTIAKVNSKTFSAGDSILFKKGDVWREMLVVPSSGTSGSYLKFASYGSGANPRIVGSNQCLTWTVYSGNVWVSATTVTDPYTVGSYGAEVFFENTDGTVSWGVHQSSPSSCTAEYNWTCSSSKIYIYSSSDPNSRYTSVEAPQRTNSVNLNDKNYLDFNGIDVFYVAESGFTYNTYPMQLHNGLIIENSKVGYVSVKNSDYGYGIDAGYSDMTVRGCDIHDCGRRGISFHIYGSYNLSNVLIENNYFHDGFHTTGPDFSVGSSSSYLTNIDNVIIRRNTFSDPVDGTAYAHQMFFQNYRYSTLDATISNVYIYSNIFLTPSYMATAIMTEGIQSIYIYNNTFYNNNNGGSYHVWVNSNCSLVKLKNNIFYTTSTITADARGTGLFIKSTQDYSKIDADYNLYYRINNSLEIIEREYVAEYYMNSISLIRSELGYETHSPTPADPQFVSTSDLHLQSTSPAVGAGLAIPEVTMDFDGNAFTDPPNIGCYSTKVAAGAPVYVSSSIENATPAILTMTYNQNLANIVPSVSAFTVMVNGVARSVTLVSVSGTKVVLTLSSAVVYGDAVTVAYTAPSSNPLQTSTGSLAASITAKSVTNNVASSIPAYVSSSVANATPTTLTMIYNLSLANIVPATSAFTVMVNGVARTVTLVTISGTNVVLTLASAVIYGDVVTVAYTAPSTNPLQTSSGGVAASITAQAVTNNVSSAVPTYVSSSVENATPTKLTMVYNLTLANIVPSTSAFSVIVNSVARSVTRVTVSGTTVVLTLGSAIVYGDVITVAYTKPANNRNPLQTSTGAQAASLTAQPVTNNLNPPSPTYVSSVIENATPSLLTVTLNLTLANIVPATSAFTVMVNGVARTVSVVAISGTTVQLTLASSVVYGDVVTVAYTKPSGNPLQSSAGGQVATFTAVSVTNNVNAAIPTYVNSVIENATPSLITITYNLALADIVPATSAFTVTVNGVTRTVSTVAVSETSVLLTLSSPVVYGDVITLSYTAPSSNPLQTSDGGQVASMTARTVTNNVTAVSLTYVSSVIENANTSLLTMTYNLTLANIVPATSAFTVLVNGTARTVTNVTISGTNVLLTLASAVSYGDIVTVSYTKPTANPLQTSSGITADSITGQPVTNNVNPSSLSYVSSVIQNATPTLLTMTFNMSLANVVPDPSAFTILVNGVVRTVTSVGISGTQVLLTFTTPVVYGDVVTVAYTKPATNPLQSSSDGEAASLTAQSVTNNVNPVNPTYVSSVIENATPALLTMTYNLTLANIVPAVSAFRVRVNNVTRQITSVTVSGTNVILTLASAVVYGNVVTVTYIRPSSNPLQTPSGGKAISIYSKSVTNNVQSITPTSPVYVSSSIENATPSLLTMTYDLSLANIVPSTSAFTVMVNSVTRTVTGVTVSGTNVLLTLTSPVVNGDVVTVAYTKPSSNPLQTAAGGQAATITAQSVTNNVNPVNVDNPNYVSSVIENATPDLLDITFDLSLADVVPDKSAFTVLVNSVSVTISSVAISGTDVLLTLANSVVYGDKITVAYRKPATNPVQSTSGGQASSFSAQTVTNNVNVINPVAPTYISSVIENYSPSLLVMTYDLNMATVIPDISAFTVNVNSVTRAVNAVSVSGTRVLLTLVSPVVFGDIVTISYTVPATNPLQSSSGVNAGSLSEQPVTNHVSFINSPPVISINYESDVFSGFVSDIDASGSYDVDYDSLTFTWTTPDNVEVSSTSGSEIRFLAPIVQETTTYEFVLTVSDGTAVQSQTISINVQPYKPEMSAASIKEVTASDYYDKNYPANVIDNNFDTRWSSDGPDRWILFKLANSFEASYFELAFQKGQKKASYFDFYASKDGITWDPVLLKASSCNFASGFQIFDVSALLANTGYTFFKIIGQGNSEDSWNNYSEFKLFGRQHYDEVQMNIYPNPTQDVVNISFKFPTDSATEEPIVMSSIIRFFDASGKIALEKSIEAGVTYIQIPISFKNGFYIIQMISGGLTISAGKLIVVH